MELHTQSVPFKRVRSVNSTSTSFTHPSVTRTEPTNLDAATATAQVVIDLVKNDSGIAANGVMLIPYSTGNDDDTYDIRVVVWREVQAELGSIDPATVVWVPVEVCQFSAVASTYTGATNGLLPTTARFADTITLVRPAADNAHVTTHSPANNTPAHILIDLKGARKFEVLFDATDADVTGMNALYALL